MYDEMYGENEQLYVTYAYGEAMWKKGFAKGLAEAKKEGMRDQREKDIQELSDALYQNGISSEKIEEILTELRKTS